MTTTRTRTRTTASHRAAVHACARHGRTGGRARAARWAVLAMSALAMVIAGVGCSGRVSIAGPGFRGDVTFRESPAQATAPVTRCGEGTYDGRPIELYCDAHGRLVFIKDLTTGRWYRVSSPEPMLPPDVPHFTFHGMAYILPPEPAETTLSLPDGSNEEILEQWGGAIHRDGSVRAGGAWQYDRGLDQLDLSICLDGTTWLPEPDAFPLAYELIVLPDADLPLMLHRVVGSRADVLAYMDAIGVEHCELDVDGYGPVPAAMLQLLQTLWRPPQPS
ncbi:MAG: hypothetical protein KF817_03530 [Phycisphaeraceae bacterium]|nr:hypothetical protein [Phycisphaeraceae bacterium]